MRSQRPLGTPCQRRHLSRQSTPRPWRRARSINASLFTKLALRAVTPLVVDPPRRLLDRTALVPDQSGHLVGRTLAFHLLLHCVRPINCSLCPIVLASRARCQCSLSHGFSRFLGRGIFRLFLS